MKGNCSGQPKTNSNWFLFKSWSKNETTLVWSMPRENLIDFLLNFNWKLKDVGLGNLRETLIDFYSNLNRTWEGIGLGNVWIESDWFPFRFQLKLKWNCCGQPKTRSNCFFFFLDFNQKWHEIGLETKSQQTNVGRCRWSVGILRHCLCNA